MRLLATTFDAVTVRRAIEYVEEGRVHLVKPPPWPVVARVRGTQGYVTTVRALPSGLHLRGECSCPVEVDCKHAAATALVALLRDDAGAEDRALAMRQGMVADWLVDLGRSDDVEAAPAGAPTREVAFVLADDATDGAIALTVMHCARHRDGTLGGGQAMTGLGDPARGAPRWVPADDLRRIALVRAASRAAATTVRLPVERLDGALLRDLADSGRLFWRTPQTAPLTWGPAVTEPLTWRAAPDEAASFRLGVPDGSPRLIVAAASTHYVDPGAAQIGPLEVGVAPALVARLIAGPAVPASMRSTVERSLGPLLGTAVVVEPAPADVVAPHPHLAAGLDREADGGPALVLRGEAIYPRAGADEDDRFDLGEWDATRAGARDLVREGRWRARLAHLVRGLPSGGQPSNSVALLGDARFVAEELVPKLRGEGWTCTLADDFPHEAPLTDVEFVERLTTRDDGRDWFSVELGVVIAGRTVPLLPILLQAIKAGRLALSAGSTRALPAGLNLRLPDGELVHVPAERVQRWLGPLLELELGALTRGELLVPAPVAAQLAAGDEQSGRFAAPAELVAAQDRLASLLALEPRDEPAGFGGTLRPYQRVGLAWLHVLDDAGYGGVLADDMGLGKTVQVLAFLDGLRVKRTLSRKAPALVVAPRSVLGNWAAEAARFAPKLRPTVHLGSARAEDAAALTQGALVITSYQTLLRDLAMFKQVPWRTVIFDEAQALKNPDTQLRHAAAELPARSRFCITGTPIENHLGELWSQVDLVMPGVLGRRRAFDAVFRRPIEQHGDTAMLTRLQQRLRPFMLRRRKAAVELDLPPKTEATVAIELEPAQRDLYESLRLSLDGDVRAALATAGVGGAQLAILQALLTLRQCCCDPRLVKVAGTKKTTASAKLERLMAMLGELAAEGRAVLVFSQFTSMLALIETACRDAGLDYVTLTGKTVDREAPVRAFQAGEVPIFLISLKAGGVGLNLTRADTVIHYDPWWNPSVEAQATDRAHRLGQTKPVMVYKLVARGTLEESIIALQDEKRALTTAALADGGVTSLAAADLHALYQRII